jgi:hypothetical protein
VDVPTIGGVYECCKKIVVYFSGLGRPFERTSPRHWCSRARTLQEARDLPDMGIIAGVTPGSPVIDLRNMEQETSNLEETYERGLVVKLRHMNELEYIWVGMFQMGRRSSEKEIDKIAGLAHIFTSYELPAYYESESAEDAWVCLVERMNPVTVGQLFYHFPTEGDCKFLWLPSWSQMIRTLDSIRISKTPPIITGLESTLTRIEDDQWRVRRGIWLPNCYVKGFNETILISVGQKS